MSLHKLVAGLLYFKGKGKARVTLLSQLARHRPGWDSLSRVARAFSPESAVQKATFSGTFRLVYAANAVGSERKVLHSSRLVKAFLTPRAREVMLTPNLV